MGDVDAAPLARLTDTSAEHASRAFAQLFEAEYRRVVSIAYRVLADAAEAEDVAQEVFVAFHRRHDPDAPYAAAWLHAAAAHAALNAARGNRRRRSREAAHAAHERDAVIDPVREAEAGETRREVRAALARLGSKKASVLALRYSGLSYAEVAAALGVQVGQIGTLLRRAEAALRKEMTRGTPL
jgi:RNA polymerase sigma factor (sigma-70 family)